MICKYCDNEMRLDDVDFNFKGFKGNKDNYWDGKEEKAPRLEISVSEMLEIASLNVSMCKCKKENEQLKAEIERLSLLIELQNAEIARLKEKKVTLQDRPQCCIEHNKYFSTCDTCEYGDGAE